MENAAKARHSRPNSSRHAASPVSRVVLKWDPFAAGAGGRPKEQPDPILERDTPMARRLPVTPRSLWTCPCWVL